MKRARSVSQGRGTPLALVAVAWAVLELANRVEELAYAVADGTLASRGVSPSPADVDAVEAGFQDG